MGHRSTFRSFAARAPHGMGEVAIFCSRNLLSVMTLGLSTVVGAAIPPSERDALIALYLSANGDEWLGNRNWCEGTCPLSGDPVFNEPGTECRWEGIACDDAEAHVVGVLLPNNNLNGPLPVLEALSALQEIDVAGNALSGSIPELSTLSQLAHVGLGANHFSGNVPSLSALVLLEDFRAGYNELTGSCPSLAGLGSLTFFDVSDNRLDGSIPALTDLPHLQSFDVANNELTGPVPAVQGLPALQYFYVYNNGLTGPLPDLGGLDSLLYVAVHANHLSGPLPASPASLVGGGSTLCPNDFDLNPGPNDAGWEWAVAQSPWWGPVGGGCDLLLADGFDGRS
jgi:hypothetical protein